MQLMTIRDNGWLLDDFLIVAPLKYGQRFIYPKQDHLKNSTFSKERFVVSGGHGHTSF